MDRQAKKQLSQHNSRREFLKTAAALPVAVTGMGAGVLALDSTKAFGSAGIYRIRKTEIPNSCNPQRPAFPDANCQQAGVNLMRYTVVGNNNAYASGTATGGYSATYVNNGDGSGWIGNSPTGFWKSPYSSQQPTNDWVVITTPAAIHTPFIKEIVVVSMRDDFWTVPGRQPAEGETFTLYGLANFLVEAQLAGGGGAWSVVATVRNNNKVRCHIPMPNGAANAGAFRIRFDSTPGYGGYNRLVEVEAYSATEILLPGRYTTLAAAQADIPRFQGWEADLFSGCSVAWLRAQPQYQWDVAAEDTVTNAMKADVFASYLTSATWGPMSSDQPSIEDTIIDIMISVGIIGITAATLGLIMTAATAAVGATALATVFVGIMIGGGIAMTATMIVFVAYLIYKAAHGFNLVGTEPIDPGVDPRRHIDPDDPLNVALNPVWNFMKSYTVTVSFL